MIAAIRRWRPRADVNTAIIFFTVVLLGILWTVVVAGNRAEREEAVETAIQQNKNLAVAYEEHIARTLNGLDGVLRFIRHEYRRLGRKLDINEYVDEGMINGHLFTSLSVVDEHGNIVVSSRGTEPAASFVNYADRDFFRAHQLRRNDDTFYINKPVLGRISNAWQVPMSRGITRPDGTFGGVVVLSVDPSYFTRFYQKAEIGDQGAVFVVGTDGIVRARRVGDTLSFGGDMSDSILLREQAKSREGTFLSAGGVDGLQRYVSYRTLSGYPLVVAVGAARNEVLAESEIHRNRDYVLTLVASVVLLLLAGTLIFTLEQQKRANRELATSEARFRATFEQAAIGIAHTSLDRRYLAVNHKFCDMLGYTPEELVGMAATSLTHPDDRDDEGVFKEKLLHGGEQSLSAEKRYIRKDGSVIWANRTVSLVRDATGEPLYFLRVVEDITARKRLEAELLEMATTDALTGLPNRRMFIARLEEEYARIRRFDSQPVAVLMLDLDYFKRINDTYGHAAGDEVLRQVAMLIRDETRRVDLCSRIGGEEFAILLAGAAPAAAREFAERLRAKIAAAAIVHEGRVMAVTASIGIAAMKATDEAADTALLHADGALYHAKDFGRNQVKVVADDEPGSAGGAAA